MTDYIIRQLDPDELDNALELSWNVYLEFEAPDYGPQGVETFQQDIMDNEKFKEGCRSGANRMWGAFDGEKLVS